MKNSYVVTEGRKTRMNFACERSGAYRHKYKEATTPKRPKATGTKKCGCPFLLKGQKLESDDDWILKVVCGVHNHAAAQYFEGHSFAGRLNETETGLLVDMSKSNVKPKDILYTLKTRDEHNATTMKTIYNARHKYKIKELAGRSQMQQLLSKLSEHNYVEYPKNH